MSEQIRAVTLKRGEDLEKFYSDMKSLDYKLSMKRPMSRATNYFLTDGQAELVKADPRVLDVELLPGPDDVQLCGWAEGNTEPHIKAGVFRKDCDNYQRGTGWEYDWGKLHCAGTTAQKRIRTPGQQPLGDGETGFWDNGAQADEVTDDISIFGDGRHVDVIIMDGHMGYDAQEWTCDWQTWDTDGTPRPPGQSRFHQYDWYGELNQYIASIDDDNSSSSVGTPPYNNYPPMSGMIAAGASGHGTHVGGTVAGKFYGWAPAANIYHILMGSMNTWLMFDYIRAFHRHKPINSVTGRRNPTVCNHSWGYIYNFSSTVDNSLDPGDIGSVTWRGVTYDQTNNPNPSGWNKEGLWADFGLDPYLGHEYNKPSRMWTYIDEDVKTQIEDGVVHVGAASNEHMLQVPKIDPNTGAQHVDWDNRMTVNGYGTVYLCRGGSPNQGDAFTTVNENGAGLGLTPVNVGALGKFTDNRYATFSNYGPKVTVFAPGNHTLSAYHAYYTDPKYGGDNFFTSMSGTSMASPQVCGIAACLASGGQRFTQSDLVGYIQQHGIKDQMVFDVDPRGRETYEANTQNTLANQTTNWKITVTDATGTAHSSADDPAITIRLGDTIKFTHWGNNYWSNGVTNYSAGTITLSYLSKDKHFTGVVGAQSGNNPTLEYEVNDEIEFNNYHSSNRTVYIKTAASTGSGDLVPSGDIAGTNGGSWFAWKPSTPGTYYYCDSADASARGTINIYPEGHFYSHPLYIKTNQSTGTGNQVSNPAATGQGRKRYEEGSITWTPTAIGTYYYCHETHANMSGEIIVQANIGKIGQVGNMADESCQQGSPNLTMNAVSPRKLQVLQDGWNKKSLKGHRRNDEIKMRALQMFPRTNSFYRPIVGSNTYILDVTNSGSGSYVFNGYDRADHFENKTNAVINVKKGDIIKFVMNASGHPFWISTTQGTGQPSAGSIPANITNNGTATGATITWDTSLSPTGTTYYNCEYHGSMTGMIFVNA